MPVENCVIRKCAKELKNIENASVKLQKDIKEIMDRKVVERESFGNLVREMDKVKRAFQELPESKQLTKCLIEKCNVKPAIKPRRSLKK